MAKRQAPANKMLQPTTIENKMLQPTDVEVKAATVKVRLREIPQWFEQTTIPTDEFADCSPQLAQRLVDAGFADFVVPEAESIDESPTSERGETDG